MNVTKIYLVLMQKTTSTSLTGKQTAAFVAGNPALFKKTKLFTHAYLKRVEKGKFFFASFSYNKASNRRRFVRVISTYQYDSLNDENLIDRLERIMDVISIQNVDNVSELKLDYILFAKHPDYTDIKGFDFTPRTVNQGAFSETAINKFLRANVPNSRKVGTSEFMIEHKEASESAKSKRTALVGYTQVGKFHVKKATHQLFEAIAEKAKVDGAANILLLGPSGAGKTSYPAEFAKQTGMSYFKLDCALISDPEEFLGRREAEAGTTKFVESDFIKAVTAGNAVILLDELNRVQPWIANGIFSLLDDTRSCGDYKVGHNVIFCATTNVGSKFTGAFVLDAALANRFNAAVVFDYPVSKVEAKILVSRVGISNNVALSIVKIASALRKFEAKEELGVDVSVRTSLRIAELFFFSKMPLRQCVAFAIASFISDADAEKMLWDAVNPVLEELDWTGAL